MNTYQGEPVSVLRSQLLSIIDDLEDGYINDDEFIERVFRTLGRDPADWLATDYGLDSRDGEPDMSSWCVCHDAPTCPDGGYDAPYDLF